MLSLSRLTRRRSPKWALADELLASSVNSTKPNIQGMLAKVDFDLELYGMAVKTYATAADGASCDAIVEGFATLPRWTDHTAPHVDLEQLAVQMLLPCSVEHDDSSAAIGLAVASMQMADKLGLRGDLGAAWESLTRAIQLLEKRELWRAERELSERACTYLYRHVQMLLSRELGAARDDHTSDMSRDFLRARDILEIISEKCSDGDGFTEGEMDALRLRLVAETQWWLGEHIDAIGTLRRIAAMATDPNLARWSTIIQARKEEQLNTMRKQNLEAELIATKVAEAAKMRAARNAFPNKRADPNKPDYTSPFAPWSDEEPAIVVWAVAVCDPHQLVLKLDPELRALLRKKCADVWGHRVELYDPETKLRTANPQQTEQHASQVLGMLRDVAVMLADHDAQFTLERAERARNKTAMLCETSMHEALPKSRSSQEPSIRIGATRHTSEL